MDLINWPGSSPSLTFELLHNYLFVCFLTFLGGRGEEGGRRRVSEQAEQDKIILYG